MGAARTFDHDEARRLRFEKGWTREAIAARFGVHVGTIDRVIYPARREAERRAIQKFNTKGRCEDCGAACTPMESREARRRYRGRGPVRVVCKRCAERRDTARRQSERLGAEGRVHCSRCDEHRERGEFRTDARGYPVEWCRSCETAARREYRRSHPDVTAAENRRRYERTRRARALQRDAGGE